MPHVQEPRSPRRVYLIGICGTAMASLAGMLSQRGITVGGSDEHVYPPMSTYLRELGIDVLEGYTKEHLQTFRPDLVVIGNVAARTNPEAVAVLESDLPYTSMPEAIHGLFMKQKHSVVVAGTHGKTTTTSLMAWVLEAAGRDPSFVVGGIPVNFQRNFKLGGGNEFVIEGDEYNTAFFDRGPKFLHYHANSLMLNNIEFDHADIYDDLGAIVRAFRAAVEQVGSDDLIVANEDDEEVRGLRAAARGRWVSYGLAAGRDYRADRIEYVPEGTSFTAWREGREWFRFRTTLSGPHNVLNALACAAVASDLGVPPEAVQKGFESFEGIRRRMEVRGVERGVTVIDDFAHHPTAIATTLRGAKGRYPGRRVWAVFEPKSISAARKEFEEGYIAAFREADRVIIGPIYYEERYRTRYGIDKLMSVDRVVGELARSAIPAEHIESFEEIARRIAEEGKEGDVVLVMSSGAFGGIHDMILEALGRTSRAAGLVE
ncbi:MAG TPA: UDP-N-acetylmuramate:L-alanyl-gamma-D-glutamyl-meso-diaminopimelate ligase [Thermoanaerobaculia bacterium]|nr:UDP-N-acetylmuramate:L-alanyl-gamma-D-glutamyl-meso-diaminopimelate ligase [Thermoanaerobaculia bacterium]